MKQNCVDLEYKKYPAQMLEVAGDLRRALAKFENPAVEVAFSKMIITQCVILARASGKVIFIHENKVFDCYFSLNLAETKT